MKHSEFETALALAFGSGYAESVARDQSISALGSRTAREALAEGIAPREVWHALCDAYDVPEKVRWSFRDEPDDKVRAR